VYRHCLFCNEDLGENEVIEALPIGRRLAYDEARGRLWVVCRKCERWNLTPFDARWEAIETCERAFRETRLRASTENIGLARVSEGLELVRIGTPLRPEMAAWRYGDQFGRRRKRHALVAGGAVSVVVGLQAGLGALGMGIGAFAGMWGGMYTSVMDRMNRVKIPTADGRLVYLVPSKAQKARVEFTESKRLLMTVRVDKRIERWYDDDARAIAGQILPRANIAGAKKKDVQHAVELIASAEPSDDPLMRLLGRRRMETSQALKIKSLTTPQRLALEMALHEEQERRALDGELKALEERWRAAEEIAAIADSLTLPDSVEEQFKNLKRRSE
jgi:hypothetical protein